MNWLQRTFDRIFPHAAILQESSGNPVIVVDDKIMNVDNSLFEDAGFGLWKYLGERDCRTPSPFFVKGECLTVEHIIHQARVRRSV